MHRLFLTRDRRLNLFWRLLTFTLCYFLLLLVAMALQELAFRLPRSNPLGTLIYATLAVAGTYSLTRFYRTHADKRPWSGMALPSLRGRAAQLLLGFAAGVALFGLVFLIDWQAGWLEVLGFETAASGPTQTLSYMLAGLLFGFVPGFTEELVFRGYWFQNIGEGRPLWFSTLIMGGFFALMHISEWGPRMLLFLPSAIIISAGLVITRLLTGSLWLAIGWHTAWDFAQWHIFGISAGARHYPLIAVKMTGPAWLVGPHGMPEEGLVGIGVQLLGVALLLAWLRWRKLRIDWRAILGADGRPVPAEESFASMANKTG